MDYNEIRSMHNSLKGILEQLEVAAATQHQILRGPSVKVYEDFLASAEVRLPGRLSDFDKNEHYSHPNRNTAASGAFYQAPGILAHIASNLGELKGLLDSSTENPATEAKDFSFISNAELRKILERDYQEIQKASISSSWKSVIILSGGSIEAILLDLLSRDEAATRAAASAPGESDLSKWDLSKLIDVAAERSIVRGEISKLSHTIREYRNLIHPGLELRSNLSVKPEEAKIAFEVLNILIRGQL